MINFIKKLIPKEFKKEVRRFHEYFFIKKVKRKQKQALKKLKGKRKIKVAFLSVYESMWKYEKLYFLMQNDEHFEPVVFVCPFKTYGDEIMKKEMESSYSAFLRKGYSVKKTLKQNGKLLDIKKEFKPGLVFFTTPWNHTSPEYQIDNYLNTLTGYVNYSYTTSTLYKQNYNKALHNYTWKYFVESDFHKKLATKHSVRKGENALALGYAGLDNFLDPNYEPDNPWKIQKKIKKRIIWAPHHTISGAKKALDYATFLKFSKFMVHVAKKYEDQIQIAFKPHPNLRGKLNDVWGKESTDNYYDQWQKMPNSQLEEGDYIDLFLQSDAMIHDCSSFLVEYLYTQKPVLFLVNNEKMKNQFNTIGKKALMNMPLGYTEKDILDFINDTIIEGKDPFKNKREQFFKEYLKPPNNQLASQNIYEYLRRELNII